MSEAQFIVVEGLDGAGKALAINALTDFLKSKNITDVIYAREPGGTAVAEQLRAILKNKSDKEQLDNKTELLLMYASRNQLINEVIKPAIRANKWVICDRFDLSTFAYQGYGRGLDLKIIRELSQFILDDIKPDLTIYMDIDPKIGLSRADKRGKRDRIEQENIDFFEKVQKGYKALIKNDKTVISIDASKSIADVSDNIRQALNNWFSKS